MLPYYRCKPTAMHHIQQTTTCHVTLNCHTDTCKVRRFANTWLRLNGNDKWQNIEFHGSKLLKKAVYALANWPMFTHS